MTVHPIQVVESASAAERLDAAAAFLRQFPAHQPVTIVAATRGAADDLARRLAVERGATLGLARFSLTQLAARVALLRLGGRGLAPATALGSEAVAARAAFDAARDGTLSYLARVADTPGFSRALARTLGELRTAGIPATTVAAAGHAGPDLALLLASAEHELAEAATADRAALFAAATELAAEDPSLRHPLLLLDVGINSEAEQAFVRALLAACPAAAVTIPAHDPAAWEAVATTNHQLPTTNYQLPTTSHQPPTDLVLLRQHLFSEAAPAPRALDGSLQFFSAPGEGREAVEIARRILAEARRGVRFDEMAVLLRTPHQYHGLLEHALERAGVPAWFDRGTRRPHPAGRAFLALLACAADGLSARGFAEYLSLDQIPNPKSQTPNPKGETEAWAASTDEAFGITADVAAAHGDEEAEPPPAKSLATPRRWERLLIDAAVVGGTPARWARRLSGLRAEMARRMIEARRDDPGSARGLAIERDIERLDRLQAFALPLITEMAGWPAAASWGRWLDGFEQFVPRVIRTPGYVLRVLADLRPMATVGPVSLREVQSVLADRLRLVDAEPPARRYGRVFVAMPAQVRGRAFRVVFLPGLAERLFPQKPRQDPLLLDEARRALPRPLPTRTDQSRAERLLLHLAAGAARERLYVSYPRLDVAEARVRVPSFYVLDLMRGATGRIPEHETLAEAAAAAADATLAWPAPKEADQAIDDQEHDLAVLRALLDTGDPLAVRGHAQYLLRLSPALRRSVTERWARGERKWTQFDGLIRVTERTAALARERLTARPYSLSALQKFAACPYQFLLSAIYRLEPSEQPQPLQRLDPLTRGSLVHSIQAEFLRTLQQEAALPVAEERVDAALATLAGVIERVAAAARDDLVPAIDRVWRDELDAIGRDLRGWVRELAREGTEWVPRHFELAFGLPRMDEPRDPHSVADPVTIDGRFSLRGAIDLVEERIDGTTLRVTDHKTGKNRTSAAMIIDGGAALQPVLYSAVVEQMTGRTVEEGRLSFCTAAGGFSEKRIPITPDTRRRGIEVLEIIDRAIEAGFLAAAPRAGACQWCDFRQVCGPNEEQRVGRKPVDPLRDLLELRSRP